MFILDSVAHTSIIGDSITAGATGAANKWQRNGDFFLKLRNKRIRPPISRPYSNTSGSLPYEGRFPTFSEDGQSGRAIGDVSSSIMSHVSAGSTRAIIQLGVNDAANGTDNDTLTSWIDEIHTDLTGGGVTGGLWIGPFAHGEHWPSPSILNDIDIHIDRIDALLASLVTSFSGWDYVSWRAVFNTWEPIRNPTNLGSGIFTSDGTHPTHTDPVGMGILIDAVVSKIVIAP
jgi:lysophospholipase L1-like esterase